MPNSAAELAAMRAEMVAEFDQTATRRRNSGVSADGYGGVTSTGNTEVSYPCRVRQIRAGDEVTEGGGSRSVRTWKILFAHDADVVVTDKVLIGGVSYDVLAVDPGKSDRLCLVVDCMLTQ